MSRQVKFAGVTVGEKPPSRNVMRFRYSWSCLLLNSLVFSLNLAVWLLHPNMISLICCFVVAFYFGFFFSSAIEHADQIHEGLLRCWKSCCEFDARIMIEREGGDE